MAISIRSIRRTLLIIGFIAIVILIGWLIYILFFRPTPPAPPGGPTATTTPPTAGLPEAPPAVTLPRVEEGIHGKLPSAIARGGLTKTTTVTQNPVKNIIKRENEIAYYDDINGQFFTVNNDGTIVALSQKKFPQVQNVTWSPNSNNAILEFPDGSNIFYDFKTNEQVTLPKHWSEFAYSPEGDRIVFKSIALEPENNFLAVSDPRGGEARIIASIGENAHRVIPEWSPNRQIVASYPEPLDGNRQELFFIGLNDENFKSVTVNGYGFNARWNPNGTQLLYNVSSSATNENPSLWIVNAQGDAIGTGRHPLNIQTTVDKCVFENETTLYCAVPQFLPEGSGILPQIARTIPDDIYKINVETGSFAKIAEPDIPLTITSLMLSPDGRLLYFTDAVTGRLRSIRLR